MALFDEDLIRDPGFFKENTIPAHADISYFRNEDELRARSSSFWHSLNGLWKFRWYRTLDEACPDFYKTDHSFDLPEIHYTYVRVGLGQMGVGGDDSWGSRPLPAYMINNRKPLKLKFSFRGV